MEEVYDTLISKEQMRHLARGSGNQAEDLVVHGRNHDRSSSKNMRGRSKSRHAENVCHYCKKGHIRVDCYSLKKKKYGYEC